MAIALYNAQFLTTLVEPDSYTVRIQGGKCGQHMYNKQWSQAGCAIHFKIALVPRVHVCYELHVVVLIMWLDNFVTK